MKETREIAEAFSEHSERYEEWFSGGEGELIRETEVRAVRTLVPDGRGLEIGVGSGIFASELGVEFGVDPAEDLVRKARSRELEVALGVGEMLPFADESFDFVLSVASISFLEDPGRTFEEVHRVLRPGGKVVVCFIPEDGAWGELYKEKKSEGHDFYRHARFHDASEVEEMLEDSGFEVDGTVSTLFQEPGSVREVEEPVEGSEEPGGFCCIRGEMAHR